MTEVLKLRKYAVTNAKAKLYHGDDPKDVEKAVLDNMHLDLITVRLALPFRLETHLMRAPRSIRPLRILKSGELVREVREDGLYRIDLQTYSRFEEVEGLKAECNMPFLDPVDAFTEPGVICFENGDPGLASFTLNPKGARVTPAPLQILQVAERALEIHFLPAFAQ